MPKDKEMTFEQANRKLEEIVAKMERGDVELDECMKLYEKAYELLNICTARLNECKGTVADIHERLGHINGQNKATDNLFED